LQRFERQYRNATTTTTSTTEKQTDTVVVCVVVLACCFVLLLCCTVAVSCVLDNRQLRSLRRVACSSFWGRQAPRVSLRLLLHLFLFLLWVMLLLRTVAIAIVVVVVVVAVVAVTVVVVVRVLVFVALLHCPPYSTSPENLYKEQWKSAKLKTVPLPLATNRKMQSSNNLATQLHHSH